MMRAVWTLGWVMVCVLATTACKPEPKGAPVVNRAPKVAGPTTEQAIAASKEVLLRDLEPIPPLGEGKNIQTPDGEGWTRFDNGVMIQELRVGLEGYPPKLGQTVSVAYIGTIPGTNKEFDRSKPDQPLTFKMGSKGLIKGFSIGISTMHVNGKRRVYLPPELAYGEKGGGGDIGPNQPLIFQIELLSVTGQAVEIPADTKPAPLSPLDPVGPPAPPAPPAPATAPATATKPAE